MHDDDLRKELLVTFAAEAEERLESMNRHLLSLERGSEGADRLLEEIFREAHSLKGAARAVSAERVEAVAHCLESLFGQIQSGDLDPTPHTYDLVYQAADAMGVLVREATGGATADVDVESLTQALTAAANGSEEHVDPQETGDGRSSEASADREASLHAVDSPVPPQAPATEPTVEPSGAEPEPSKAREVGEVIFIPPVSRASAAGKARPSPGPRAATPAPHGAAPTDDDEDGLRDGGEAAESPEAGRAAAAEEHRTDEVVRVAVSKLDSLMAQVGELLVTSIGIDQSGGELRALGDALTEWEAVWRRVRPAYRDLVADLEAHTNGSAAKAGDRRAVIEFLDDGETKLRALRSRLTDLTRRFEADTHRMSQVTGELEEDVRRTRMFPIATIFSAFPRMVRDLARSSGKEVALEFEGGETEVDRSVLDEIRSPLTHLLRNGIDHGIESGADRLAAGKPEEATIRLSASQRGDSLVIEVSDDGAGIDTSRVRSTAVRKGLMSAEDAQGLNDREVIDLIYRPGFSTSAIITDLSGRGVGLDVVRETVERLQGVIAVETQPGSGTTFTLTLPLSVATTRCLLVTSGGRTYALSTTNVLRIVRIADGDVDRAEGRDAVVVDRQPIAFTELSALLQSAGADSPDIRGKRPTVIVGAGQRRMACAVDALQGVQDVVMKPLPAPLYRVKNVAGATILGTGEVVCVLNPADLLRSAEMPRAHRLRDAGGSRPTSSGPPIILLAEDSITTRTLEKNILEAAGYVVRVAADGLQAWEILQEEHCDLLVSDIQMPRMDGFDLTRRVREHDALGQLPVILVTALDSPEDRERGISVGADAYITKGSFDQDRLLETIRRII